MFDKKYISLKVATLDHSDHLNRNNCSKEINRYTYFSCDLLSQNQKEGFMQKNIARIGRLNFSSAAELENFSKKYSQEAISLSREAL